MLPTQNITNYIVNASPIKITKDSASHLFYAGAGLYLTRNFIASLAYASLAKVAGVLRREHAATEWSKSAGEYFQSGKKEIVRDLTKVGLALVTLYALASVEETIRLEEDAKKALEQEAARKTEQEMRSAAQEAQWKIQESQMAEQVERLKEEANKGWIDWAKENPYSAVGYGLGYGYAAFSTLYTTYTFLTSYSFLGRISRFGKGSFEKRGKGSYSDDDNLPSSPTDYIHISSQTPNSQSPQFKFKHYNDRGRYEKL